MSLVLNTTYQWVYFFGVLRQLIIHFFPKIGQAIFEFGLD